MTVGLDLEGVRLGHDDLLVGHVVYDRPVEEHVGRRHEVLDERENAERCVNIKIRYYLVTTSLIIYQPSLPKLSQCTLCL